MRFNFKILETEREQTKNRGLPKGRFSETR